MTRLLFLLFLPLWALVLPAHALQVLDDRGVPVTLLKPPRRIVSLLPSLTETVCELGGCQRLVGVDRYSDYPPSVRSLPQLGGGLDPNIEAIVALRPDLVLMATSSRAGARLESLGLKVLMLEPKTAADVRRALDRIGQVLEFPDPQRIWRGIDAAVSAAAHSLPASARNTSVYFEVNSGPYAAGTSSFIGETLARLGVRNIVGPALGPFPRINPEYVVRADPDLIMVSERNGQELGQRPGWARMRAIREQRTCFFTPQEGVVLMRPGPRMAEAARLMARCIADKAR